MSYMEEYKKKLNEYQDFDPERDSEEYLKQLINTQVYGLQMLALLEESGIPKEYLDGLAFNVYPWVSHTINLSNITAREAEQYKREIHRAITLYKMTVPKQYTNNHYWQMAETHIRSYVIFPLSVGIDGFGRKQLNTRIVKTEENIRAEEINNAPPVNRGWMDRAKNLVGGR